MRVVSAFRALVPQRAPLHDVIYDFGDVGRMIAHPLDILDVEQQMRAKGDAARILHHVSEELSEQRVVDGIDLLVVASYLERLGDLGANVAVENLIELIEDELCHAPDAKHHLVRLRDRIVFVNRNSLRPPDAKAAFRRASPNVLHKSPIRDGETRALGHESTATTTCMWRQISL
jgi:hypothetical protein